MSTTFDTSTLGFLTLRLRMPSVFQKQEDWFEQRSDVFAHLFVDHLNYQMRSIAHGSPKTKVEALAADTNGKEFSVIVQPPAQLIREKGPEAVGKFLLDFFATLPHTFILGSPHRLDGTQAIPGTTEFNSLLTMSGASMTLSRKDEDEQGLYYIASSLEVRRAYLYSRLDEGERKSERHLALAGEVDESEQASVPVEPSEADYLREMRESYARSIEQVRKEFRLREDILIKEVDDKDDEIARLKREVNRLTRAQEKAVKKGKPKKK